MAQRLVSTLKLFKTVKENVDKDGLLHVARRIWNNHGQFRFGTLVGVDEFGNRYYEDMEADENGTSVNGRHRWVEYPTLNRYKTSGSKVPPEWHGWLHYITDMPASEVKAKYEPFYKVTHRESRTGTSDAYMPNNYMKNPKYNVLQATDSRRDLLDEVVVPKENARKKYSADEL